VPAVPTLSRYLTQTRRLLRDANSTYWTDNELTDHINTARAQTVMDTGCLRGLCEFVTVVGQEFYDYFDTFLTGASPPYTMTVTNGTTVQTSAVVDIMGINVIWSQTRYPLMNSAFSRQSAYFRPWTNYQQQPATFATYGQRGFNLAPIPDQAYDCEADVVYLPVDMAAPTDEEVIDFPFTDCVPFYAAFKAQLSYQSFEKAAGLKMLYAQRAVECISQTKSRMIPNAYE